VWRGSLLTSLDLCKVGSFDRLRGWRCRVVDVAGDGTWSHVVREIKDIVASALASLHRGGRPLAQSPGHLCGMLDLPGRSRRLRWWR
tara:strand:- start:2978 stop:3238 length:261 start_codon:yes stop_codon:yes gene_type:complete